METSQRLRLSILLVLPAHKITLVACMYHSRKSSSMQLSLFLYIPKHGKTCFNMMDIGFLDEVPMLTFVNDVGEGWGLCLEVQTSQL